MILVKFLPPLKCNHYFRFASQDWWKPGSYQGAKSWSLLDNSESLNYVNAALCSLFTMLSAVCAYNVWGWYYSPYFADKETEVREGRKCAQVVELALKAATCLQGLSFFTIRSHCFDTVKISSTCFLKKQGSTCADCNPKPGQLFVNAWHLGMG